MSHYRQKLNSVKTSNVTAATNVSKTIHVAWKMKQERGQNFQTCIHVEDLRFSQWWVRRWLSSGL
jgi:hypothetical protein